MLASERLIQIEEHCLEYVQRIVPLDLDGETLRLIIYLNDGTNLRVTEQWKGDTLERYSYYWLTANSGLDGITPLTTPALQHSPTTGILTNNPISSPQNKHVWKRFFR